MSDLLKSHTERGFAIVKFTDCYGVPCSIQESSSAEEPKIWLGPSAERMHLTQSQVAGLMPLLQKFLDTGRL